MRLTFMVVLPLVLAACSAPSALPDQDGLGLQAAQPGAARGTAAVGQLFPDYTPRKVTEPGDWQQLNGDQAPQGASQ